MGLWAAAHSSHMWPPAIPSSPDTGGWQRWTCRCRAMSDPCLPESPLILLSRSLPSLYTVFFVLPPPNCLLLLMANHVSYYRHGQDWSARHLRCWSCRSGDRHSSICLLSKGFTACYTASIEENWLDSHCYSHLKEGLGTLKVPSCCTGGFVQVDVGLGDIWERDPSRQTRIQLSLANLWVRKGILKSSIACTTVVSVTAANPPLW